MLAAMTVSIVVPTQGPARGARALSGVPARPGGRDRRGRRRLDRGDPVAELAAGAGAVLVRLPGSGPAAARNAGVAAAGGRSSASPTTTARRGRLGGGARGADPLPAARSARRPHRGGRRSRRAGPRLAGDRRSPPAAAPSRAPRHRASPLPATWPARASCSLELPFDESFPAPPARTATGRPGGGRGAAHGSSRTRRRPSPRT